MTKRAVVVVLAVLLLSYLPAMGENKSSEESILSGLEINYERVEISPDPRSIKGFRVPIRFTGLRRNSAGSRTFHNRNIHTKWFDSK